MVLTGGELKSFRTLKRMKNKQAALVNSSLFSMRLHFRHSAHHFSTLWKWAHGLNLGIYLLFQSLVLIEFQ
jgi:hypothetical protein